MGPTMSKVRKSALVTGVLSGIGAAYTDHLAARGYDLVLVARRREKLERLADRLRSNYHRHTEVISADLAVGADVARVEEAVRGTAGLDVLVNCAGSGALGPSTTVDPDTLEGMLKVNILALTRLSLVAARRFATDKHSTIINIGSILAVMPVPGAGSYSGSKTYVLNFSRALQAELADSGVTVQVVMPGPVRSEFFGERPPPFPKQLFMTSETLVDTALAALDQGETVTFPNLQDLATCQQFETARSGLVKAVTQNGHPASRYDAAHTAANV